MSVLTGRLKVPPSQGVQDLRHTQQERTPQLKVTTQYSWRTAGCKFN